MNTEKLVSEMMTINVQARLWHWTTNVAQHHTTYESFLTQNEQFTDSFVESCLGNEHNIEFNSVQVSAGTVKNYSLEDARKTLKTYRTLIKSSKETYSNSDNDGGEELITILDDVTELCSKTLYLLSLT